MERVGDTAQRMWEHYMGREDRCRAGARRLVEGLLASHAAEVVHCDIQPENICKDGDSDGLRLIDWGTAVNTSDEVNFGTCQRGACRYRSPEMLGEVGWEKAHDMWSVGVVLAELYLGEVWSKEESSRPWQLFPGPDESDDVPPTEILKHVELVLGRLPERTRKNIEQCTPDRYGVASELFSRFPPLYASFLAQLLVYDHKDRLTAEEALMHPWLATPDHEPQALEAWLHGAFQRLTTDGRLRPGECASVSDVIAVLASRGPPGAAQEWLRTSVRRGLELDAAAFGAVVERCLGEGKVDTSERWLRMCLRSMGIAVGLRIGVAAGFAEWRLAD